MIVARSVRFWHNVGQIKKCPIQHLVQTLEQFDCYDPMFYCF